MTKTKLEFLREYGEAYHSFGLPKLMGRIVGLLLYVDRPVSLDEITEHLNVSKGPVSQMVRRLRDHHLIERVWIPGDRKDFYRAEPDIFGRAFQNQMEQIRRNLRLAKKYRQQIADGNTDITPTFSARMEEMTEFYEMMLDYHTRFLDAWRAHKNV